MNFAEGYAGPLALKTRRTPPPRRATQSTDSMTSDVKPIKALAVVAAKDTELKEWIYVSRPFQPEDVEIRIVAAGVCVRSS